MVPSHLNVYCTKCFLHVSSLKHTNYYTNVRLHYCTVSIHIHTQKLGGSLVQQGYIVASFSFGRALFAPAFGRWNVRSGSYRWVLILALSIMMFGCLLYTQVQRVNSISFLIGSQIVLGIGSATLGVTRGYVAHVTTKQYRTMYIAWLTSLQYAGFTVMPFVGSYFSNYFDNHDAINLLRG